MTETPTPAAASRDDIRRYRENYKDEVDGAALYRLLADAESDPYMKDLYLRLAVSEDRHLAIWAGKLKDAGADLPGDRPSLRVRALGWLARRFGTQLVSPIVARMEMAATAMYDGQP